MVIERVESKVSTTGRVRSRWKCSCDCGNEKIIYSDDLKSGKVNSCGCLKKEKLLERSIKDLAGEKFGSLTVVSYFGSKNKRSIWRCKCDCGSECIADSHSLLQGRTKTCGCGKKMHNYKHGKIRTRLYRIWTAMKTRCGNPNADNYQYYGGRGISVCEEWKEDFEAFFAWAMTNGYQDNLTIDRKDNDGNYTPDNCRWVTMEEQNKNKRAKGSVQHG